jgi:hypothetical protein
MDETHMSERMRKTASSLVRAIRAHVGELEKVALKTRDPQEIQDVHLGAHIALCNAIGFIEMVITQEVEERETAVALLDAQLQRIREVGRMDARLQAGEDVTISAEGHLLAGDALYTQAQHLVSGLVTVHVQRKQSHARYDALRVLHGALAWQLGRLERHLMVVDEPDIENKVRAQREQHMKEGDHKGSHETGSSCPDCSDA